MSVQDWENDANQISLPAIVSNSGLFDGELFGDELIDIYNSSVGEHCDPHNEIPDLLVPTEVDVTSDQLLGITNDGLGAFRPSTSFNDLTQILSSVGGGDAAKKAIASEVSQAAKSSKKRSADGTVAPASPKRKATTSRRVSTTKKPETKKATASTSVTSVTTVKAEFQVATPIVKSTVSKEAAVGVLPTNSSIKVASNVTVKVPAAVVKTSVAPAVASIKSEPPKRFSTEAVGVPDHIFDSAVSESGRNSVSDNVSVASSASSKVDTSTAHIKALTGNNWVAACVGGAPGAAPVMVENDPKANNRARRHNLTPDERARMNRDRNREHARNTRLRKKAYVEELKRTLTELVSQRDTAELEKRQAAQRELEQREVRFRVIEEFLKLRGRNETNFARWAAILEECFVLTLPMTDFKKMLYDDVVPGTDIVLNGVSEVMSEASAFSAFLQTLGNKDAKVGFQFQCNRKKFFMDDCQAFLEWTGTSCCAVEKGASSELSVKGILRCEFSPASNKLLSANISFDTGSFLVQLQKLGLFAVPLKSAPSEFAAAQAGAILDSLQMPCVPTKVPSAVIINASSSSSEGGDQSDEDASAFDEGDKARSTSAKKGSSSQGIHEMSV